MSLGENRLYQGGGPPLIRPKCNSDDLSMMIRNALRDLTPASMVTIQDVIRGTANDT